MNTVDILMATYNGEQYIEQQIDSIIVQSYADWRLFIRDDGSKDNTVDIVRQYTLIDKRIALVEDDLGNLGVSENFAALIEHSKSQYMMFADQDDVWFKDKIEVSIAAIQNIENQNPQKAVLVFANSTITNSDISSKYGTLYAKNQKYKLKDFLFANAGYQGASMIFNEFFRKEILPFPSNIRVHDYYISLVAHLQGVVGYEPKPLAFYRRHNNSINPNNKTLSKRIKSFLAGNPILFYPDLHTCLRQYVDLHNIKTQDKILIEAYFDITDTSVSLLKRILLAFHYRFTLRNNILYLIFKLLMIKK